MIAMKFAKEKSLMLLCSWMKIYRVIWKKPIPLESLSSSREWVPVVISDNNGSLFILLVAQCATNGTPDNPKLLWGIPSMDLFCDVWGMVR